MSSLQYAEPRGGRVGTSAVSACPVNARGSASKAKLSCFGRRRSLAQRVGF